MSDLVHNSEDMPLKGKVAHINVCRVCFKGKNVKLLEAASIFTIDFECELLPLNVVMEKISKRKLAAPPNMPVMVCEPCAQKVMRVYATLVNWNFAEKSYASNLEKDGKELLSALTFDAGSNFDEDTTGMSELENSTVKTIVENTLKGSVEHIIENTVESIVETTIESIVETTVGVAVEATENVETTGEAAVAAVETTVEETGERTDEETVESAIMSIVEDTVGAIVEASVEKIVGTKVEKIAEATLEKTVGPTVKAAVKPKVERIVQPTVKAAAIQNFKAQYRRINTKFQKLTTELNSKKLDKGPIIYKTVTDNKDMLKRTIDSNRNFTTISGTRYMSKQPSTQKQKLFDSPNTVGTSNKKMSVISEARYTPKKPFNLKNKLSVSTGKGMSKELSFQNKKYKSERNTRYISKEPIIPKSKFLTESDFEDKVIPNKSISSYKEFAIDANKKDIITLFRRVATDVGDKDISDEFATHVDDKGMPKEASTQKKQLPISGFKYMSNKLNTPSKELISGLNTNYVPKESISYNNRFLDIDRKDITNELTTLFGKFATGADNKDITKDTITIFKKVTTDADERNLSNEPSTSNKKLTIDANETNIPGVASTHKMKLSVSDNKYSIPKTFITPNKKMISEPNRNDILKEPTTFSDRFLPKLDIDDKLTPNEPFALYGKFGIGADDKDMPHKTITLFKRFGTYVDGKKMPNKPTNSNKNFLMDAGDTIMAEEPPTQKRKLSAWSTKYNMSKKLIPSNKTFISEQNGKFLPKKNIASGEIFSSKLVNDGTDIPMPITSCEKFAIDADNNDISNEQTNLFGQFSVDAEDKKTDSKSTIVWEKSIPSAEPSPFMPTIPEDTKFRCDTCGKLFEDQLIFVRHFRRSHRDLLERYNQQCHNGDQ